jgi:hypothetical protein
MTAVIRVQAFLAVTTMGSNCIENLNYVEKDKVQSTTDSVILWEASCGYYATKVQSLVDLASGLDDAVQTQPEADQTVTGDFKLIFDGLSFASSIAPNELSIKSKANGGLDITADTNGLTTVKAKGVPVSTYDENGVQMLENLKMPLSYASADVNDVVVKSELEELKSKIVEIGFQNVELFSGDAIDDDLITFSLDPNDFDELIIEAEMVNTSLNVSFYVQKTISSSAFIAATSIITSRFIGIDSHISTDFDTSGEFLLPRATVYIANRFATASGDNKIWGVVGGGDIATWRPSIKKITGRKFIKALEDD